MTNGTSPFRLYWLPEQFTSPGKLGMSMLPGRMDIGRHLIDDLKVLDDAGVSHIVTLIRDDELSSYGVPNLFTQYNNAGFIVKRLPITDMGTATQEEIQELVGWLSEQLKGRQRVLVHCAGGLGRTGLVVGCYLRTRGLSAEEAIAEVRRVRSPLAIETKDQEAFIKDFQKS